MKNNIKVGTITFHQSDNYGAILQAYALQQAIKKMGFETKIINYYSDGIARWNGYCKLNFKNISLSDVKTNIYRFLIRKKKKRFQVFRNNLELTSLYDKSTLHNSAKLFDCFITGSDQVWNCFCTDEDYNYFLSFVKEANKKCSYAASFGYSMIPPEYLEKTIKFLSDISYITVRENRGVELVKEMLDINVEQVLDPVFLLEKKTWLKLTKVINKKYIFVYQAEKSPSLIHFAEKLSLIYNCPIYIVSSVWRGTMRRNTVNKSDAGPEEFLSLLLNAEAVVTNSFHGTALSIIFNKNFYTELLDNNNTNSRVESLLKMFSLTEQIITRGMEFNLDKRIDYETVNNLLSLKREESLAILKNMINNCVITQNFK